MVFKVNSCCLSSERNTFSGRKSWYAATRPSVLWPERGRSKVEIEGVQVCWNGYLHDERSAHNEVAGNGTSWNDFVVVGLPIQDTNCDSTG